MSKVTVIPGVAVPFFPMRPITGPVLQDESDIAEIEAAKDYFWQPKLGGDRVLMAKVDGKLWFANRHGSWYSFSVENSKLWQPIPGQTLLDGEVYKKKFYPFEALVVAGKSHMRDCVTVRAQIAKELCEKYGEKFLFDPVSPDWIRNGISMKRTDWEGLVGKKKNSPYLILGVKKDSPQWVKRRWV